MCALRVVCLVYVPVCDVCDVVVWLLLLFLLFVLELCVRVEFRIVFFVYYVVLVCLDVVVLFVRVF